jgi:ATP-binding cassette subfamily F protein uup
LLLLDEPTNDLDIPTLEVLEESLIEFPGALVLVTHDRFLLDRVSTAVMGLDGQGSAELFADYWQWEAAQTRPAPKVEKEAVERVAAPAKKKLSYKDAREWEQMESKILEAESELEALHAEMQSPEVVSNGPRLKALCEKVEAGQNRVAELYARWAELEKLKE